MADSWGQGPGRESRGRESRGSPPKAVQLATTYFAVTLVLIGLAAGAVAVGFGGRPASTLLRFVLGIAAGAGGLFAAAGHLLRSDDTAVDLGWPVGTPWQWEVGFADLALGVISLIAAFSRDRHVWLMAVVAMTIFLLGDAVGHLRYQQRLRAHGEAGSTLGLASIVGDLALPVALVVLLALT